MPVDEDRRADLLRAALWRLTIHLRREGRVRYHGLIEAAVDAISRLNSDPWLDQKAAARYSGYSASWLNAARCRDAGPAYYRLNGATIKGSRVFYRISDLDAFLARNRVETRPFIPSGGFR